MRAEERLALRVLDAQVWHPQVEAYDVVDGDQRVGRFYLDLTREYTDRLRKGDPGPTISLRSRHPKFRPIPSAAAAAQLARGKAPDTEVLVDFYRRIRPFGFWGPVRQHCDGDFVQAIGKENRRDLLLLGPACLWQMSLFAMMTAIVAKKWDVFLSTLLIVGVLSAVLYKFWYRNLARE